MTTYNKNRCYSVHNTLGTFLWQNRCQVFTICVQISARWICEFVNMNFFETHRDKVIVLTFTHHGYTE